MVAGIVFLINMTSAWWGAVKRIFALSLLRLALEEMKYLIRSS